MSLCQHISEDFLTSEGPKVIRALSGLSESFTLWCCCCGHGHKQTNKQKHTNKQANTHTLAHCLTLVHTQTHTHTAPLASPDMCDLISECVLQRSAKMKTLEDSRCSCALPPSHYSAPSPPPPVSLSHLSTHTHTHTHVHTFLETAPSWYAAREWPREKVHLLVFTVIHRNMSTTRGFSAARQRFSHIDLFI